MKRDYRLEKRKYVLGGAVVVVTFIYLLRLFTLQIMSEDYKKNIYYSVLRFIVNSSHTLIDAALTKKIVAYLDTHTEIPVGSFSQLISVVLNYIRMGS